MNIYENNKQLLTTMGGDSYNLATDFEVRKAILDLLGGDSSNCNSIYEVDKQILNIYLEGGGTGGDITLSPITITENGVYTAGVGNGYNKVTVNVEIPECPEIPLTAITINSNGTYIPEEGGYNEVIVDVAGGGGGAVGEKLKLKGVIVGPGPDCIENGEWAGLDNFYDYIDKNYINTMHQMFYDTPIARLDASKLDISNVYDTSDMFANCFNLQQLDVSGWNTSKVTYMGHMFNNCQSLTNLDLTNWDVSKCTSFWGMFNGCINLQSVGDLSGWGKVRDINDIFMNCQSLTNLDLTNWDVSEASSGAYMFMGCSSLQSVGDLSNWNTENFTDFTAMFNGCSSLTQLDVTNWITEYSGNMHEMFRDCSSLQQLDLTNWVISNSWTLDYFSSGSGIINYVGGRTIDDVIANNITILNNLRWSASYVMSDFADRASLRALINGLGVIDIEMDGEQSLGLSQSNLDKLTEEDIAVATEKGWSIWAY